MGGGGKQGKGWSYGYFRTPLEKGWAETKDS